MRKAQYDKVIKKILIIAPFLLPPNKLSTAWRDAKWILPNAFEMELWLEERPQRREENM